MQHFIAEANIVAKTNTTHEDRIQRVEKAIIQLNHFSESIERLDLPAWKSQVSTDLGWLKTLVTAVAVQGFIALSLFVYLNFIK